MWEALWIFAMPLTHSSVVTCNPRPVYCMWLNRQVIFYHTERIMAQMAYKVTSIPLMSIVLLNTIKLNL